MTGVSKRIPPWGWGVILILGLVLIGCCGSLCAGVFLQSAPATP